MATTTERVVNVQDRGQVAPPGDLAEKSIPLTYFDVIWVYFHPIQRLLFYKFPCSTSHFHGNLVPNLKTSLSETLGHYFPLAGNLYVPVDSSVPELRYVPGDSVSFTVAEYSSEDFDFNYLTGNQAREADAFYPFVPELSEPKIEAESGFKKVPLLSVQVTLFPETGICIGITNHHVVGDASSIVGFIKAWSAVARFRGDIADDVDELLAKNASLRPIYDRTLIKDPSGRVNIFWNQMKLFEILPPILDNNNKVRETFILPKDDIQKLRNLVLAKSPGLIHLSSFTISTAYVWSCLAKTASKIGEEVSSDEPEYYAIAVESRHRLDPPIPAAYFGNCLAFAATGSTHGELKGEEGVCNAVEVVSKFISERVNNKGELFKDADEWLVKCGPVFAKRVFGVSGSPKFDLYDTDFGWGNPEKYEVVSIDGDSAMSLCKSREFEGGLEIGMSLPKTKMDAFEAIFYGELKI